jgi:hypothetical protein
MCTIIRYRCGDCITFRLQHNCAVAAHNFRASLGVADQLGLNYSLAKAVANGAQVLGSMLGVPKDFTAGAVTAALDLGRSQVGPGDACIDST